jgi:hypothetical protein
LGLLVRNKLFGGAMQRRIPDIFLGALLAVAAFAMGSVFGSQRQPAEQISTAKADTADSQGQPHETLWYWVAHDAAGFFTLCLSAIGLFQLVLFYWQLRLIRESLDVAQKTMTSTHRPKLVVRELLMLPTSETKQNVEVRYVVANVGAGRAKIIESHVEIQDIDDRILRPLQPFEGSDLIGGVSLEAGSHIFREQSSTVSLNALTIEHMQDQRVQDDGRRASQPRLFFRGFIVYSDKNDVRRRTTFCRPYDFSGRRFCAIKDPDYEYAD